MKKTVLFFCCAIVVFICEAQNKQPLPAIRKVRAAEVRAIIDSSTGPAIINFWATWCGPCVHELTYFDSIISAKNANVKLVLVSLDFPEAYPKKLAAFVQKQQYKGEVVWLADTNANDFIPAIEKKWNGAIPASIFLDNTKGRYEMFNMQLTRERFALELDKLTK